MIAALKEYLLAAWCKAFHQEHHQLHQFEYGGGYFCDCTKCKSRNYVHR
jgi:hypothetical protein